MDSVKKNLKDYKCEEKQTEVTLKFEDIVYVGFLYSFILLQILDEIKCFFLLLKELENS